MELYVRDRNSGKAHRVGDDQHDSICVDKNGIVQYYNLQNGDGTLVGNQNEPHAGYEFVQTDDYGEVDDETKKQAQEYRDMVEAGKEARAELAKLGITMIS